MTFRFVPAALAARLALSALALSALALSALSLTAPVMAEDHPEGVHIHDAYARAMGGMGRSGAVFLTIHNHTEVDDRLVDATSDVAERVELHTHKDDGNGVMQMLHVPEGFAIAAGDMHVLARGGDHVMLLGLTRDLKDGDTFPLTLVFEAAGEITLDVPVDNARKPADAAAHDHGAGHMDGHDAGHLSGHGHAHGG